MKLGFHLFHRELIFTFISQVNTQALLNHHCTELGCWEGWGLDSVIWRILVIPSGAQPAHSSSPHLWLLLESSQLYCWRPQRQRWKCLWHVLNCPYLQAVQIQLHCARSLLQATQPQDNSMRFPISQVDVAEDHRIQPPIALQVAQHN